MSPEARKGVWVLRGLLAFFTLYFLLWVGISIYIAARNGEW